MTLRTEDTGKMFEYSLCRALDIPYDGKYKYEYPNQDLIDRLSSFNYTKWKHIASNGSPYDFIDEDGNYLSLKSTKGRNKKVAPQIIGQVKKEKFCDLLKISHISEKDLKIYIRENINNILSIFETHTFDCPVLYYNKKTNKILYIKQIKPINWDQYTMSWTNDFGINPKTDELYTSSSYGVKSVNGNKRSPICEIQFHRKSRVNMANRWHFENLLRLFNDNFEIEDL